MKWLVTFVMCASACFAQETKAEKRGKGLKDGAK